MDVGLPKFPQLGGDASRRVFSRVSGGLLASLSASLIAWGVCLFPTDVCADEYHYNDVFLGPRVSGLAGTMIGLGDDPSTAWYNPAGLSRRTSSTVSLSASALVARQLSLKSSDGEVISYKSTAAFSPAAITTTQLGHGNLAVMILEPSNDNYYLDRTFVFSDDGDEMRFINESESSSYVIGISYGASIGRGLSLGIGVGYLYETDSGRTSLYLRQRSSLNGVVYGFQDDMAWNGVRHGLMMMAGLLWMPMGEKGPLTVGLSLRTGVNISYSSSSQITSWEGKSYGEDDEMLYERNASPENTQNTLSRSPPMIGIGASWKITKNWFIAADATLHGYVAYESAGIKVEKMATVNASIATEVSVGEGLSFRGGGFTNRSNVPDSSNILSAWNEYGGTLGASYIRGKYEYILAMRFSWLVGEMADDDGAVTTSYKVSGRNVGIVFGGTYRF